MEWSTDDIKVGLDVGLDVDDDTGDADEDFNNGWDVDIDIDIDGDVGRHIGIDGNVAAAGVSFWPEGTRLAGQGNTVLSQLRWVRGTAMAVAAMRAAAKNFMLAVAVVWLEGELWMSVVWQLYYWMSDRVGMLNEWLCKRVMQ